MVHRVLALPRDRRVGVPVNLRELERESIRAFVEKAGTLGYLSGRVLDYGCGKQPYRNLVESFGASYDGYDLVRFGGNLSGRNITPPWKEGYQAVLCTQVIQYVRSPEEFARALRARLVDEGHLVMTYPTNWPEVETDDLRRFTKAGMERLLTWAGFEIVLHEPRHFARLCDESVPKKLLATEWLALGRPTIADIACYPYVKVSPEGGFKLEDYPSVQAWVKRVEALPGWVKRA